MTAARCVLALVCVGCALALPSLDDVLADFDENRPAPATTESRLTDFYNEHNPLKIGDVPKLLKKFEGREDAMFQVLNTKYVNVFGDALNGVVQHSVVKGKYESFVKRQQANRPNQPVAVFCYSAEKADAKTLDNKQKEKLAVMSKSFARRAVFLAVNFKFDDTSICTDDDRIVFFPEGAGTKAADGTTLLTEIADAQAFFDLCKEKLFPGWY